MRRAWALLCAASSAGGAAGCSAEAVIGPPLVVDGERPAIVPTSEPRASCVAWSVEGPPVELSLGRPGTARRPAFVRGPDPAEGAGLAYRSDVELESQVRYARVVVPEAWPTSGALQASSSSLGSLVGERFAVAMRASGLATLYRSENESGEPALLLRSEVDPDSGEAGSWDLLALDDGEPLAMSAAEAIPSCGHGFAYEPPTAAGPFELRTGAFSEDAPPSAACPSSAVAGFGAIVEIGAVPSVVALETVAAPFSDVGKELVAFATSSLAQETPLEDLGPATKIGLGYQSALDFLWLGDAGGTMNGVDVGAELAAVHLTPRSEGAWLVWHAEPSVLGAATVGFGPGTASLVPAPALEVIADREIVPESSTAAAWGDDVVVAWVNAEGGAGQGIELRSIADSGAGSEPLSIAPGGVVLDALTLAADPASGELLIAWSEGDAVETRLMLQRVSCIPQ